MNIMNIIVDHNDEHHGREYIRGQWSKTPQLGQIDKIDHDLDHLVPDVPL